MSKPTERTPTAELMAERYGVGSPRRRNLAIGAVGLVVVVLLGWLVWAAWHHATTTVAGSVDSFDVVSGHQVDATVSLQRPAHASATCTLSAQASDHTVVGQVVVTVPAGGKTDVRIRTTIKTDREATSVDVSCH